MKIKDLTNESFQVNENPISTLFKKAKDGADYAFGKDGAIDSFAQQVSKKYGGAHGNKRPIEPGFGKALRKGFGLGKDEKKAKAPEKNTKAKAPTSNTPQGPKRLDQLKSGSSYYDGTDNWVWNGTDWSNGKSKLSPPEGWKNFQKYYAKGKALAL